MPPPIADDDHKRRARRRLIGAVALTIIAVIILPLVLENEPPPAGPLVVHMPPSAGLEQKPLQNAVEYAPSPANSMVEPATSESDVPARNVPDSKPAELPKPVPVPAKPAGQTGKPAPKDIKVSIVYTVQVGVFSDKANAEKQRARITALGLKPYTDAVGDSTRVRVGSFTSKADAEAVASRLAAAGMAGKVVEK
jgi:DedD protein